MSPLPTIELYSDIHCPWAYMAIFRLRVVWPDYQGRVRVVFRSLALELKNRRPTPKPILDQEIPLMAEQQPDLPIRLWHAPEWKFVATLLPAFEAVKAAQEQGDEAAWEFGWLVRHAFFAHSRTICLRSELARVAGEAGLNVERFLEDWDSGRYRRAVVADSHHGWEELKVPGSPTFVLPNGAQVHNPGAIGVTWGPHETIAGTTPAGCPNGDCLQVFRDMLERAIAPE
ncbi:MAG TPA: DsbA family protein [Chloroflexota bacterium]|nr:DsbA family protein [Chloroflexota bacterium]